MWKRLRHSLTLRIFCVTSALMLAACGVTYAAIACLTPISYTSLLADELRGAGEALVKSLARGTAGESAPLLEDFARETGAQLRLMGADGTLYYDTLPEIAPGTEAVVEEVYVTQTELGFNRAATAEDAHEASLSADAVETAEEAAAGVDAVTQVMVAEDALPDETYVLRFADGRTATLTVRGGMRAVNQAAEAMARLLPYLVLILLAFSLLGAFFYARFITRPIVEISGIARRIADLDFRARWTKRREDEIGALGESLNCLSGNLSGALQELRAANAALKRDIDRERALERQRLAFFSAASHELKTPLTILRGQLSGMLAQVGVYRDREKYLARALEVAGRMERLVREILTISRIEADGFRIGEGEVDLSALVEAQLAQDGELLEQRGLHLQTEIAPGIVLRGSESLLASALDNVLMNAILYSPRGAQVWVRLDGAELRVENGGARIAEAALGHLFEPFYRVEPSRNRSSGGSGLGLYLVRSIFELHGVDCAMENTPRGVCFRARLGAKEAADSDAP